MAAQRARIVVEMHGLAAQRDLSVVAHPVRLGVRKHLHDASADDPPRGEAGKPLEGGVDIEESIVDRLARLIADDFVQGESLGHPREERTKSLLTRAQGFLHAPALGDVADDEESRALTLPGDRRRATLAVEPAAVESQVVTFGGEDGDAFLFHLPHAQPARFPVLGQHEVVEGTTHRSGGGTGLERRDSRGIHVEDIPRRMHDDAFGKELGQGSVAVLTRAQPFDAPLVLGLIAGDDEHVLHRVLHPVFGDTPRLVAPDPLARRDVVLDFNGRAGFKDPLDPLSPEPRVPLLEPHLLDGPPHDGACAFPIEPKARRVHVNVLQPPVESADDIGSIVGKGPELLLRGAEGGAEDGMKGGVTGPGAPFRRENGDEEVQASHVLREPSRPADGAPHRFLDEECREADARQGKGGGIPEEEDLPVSRECDQEDHEAESEQDVGRAENRLAQGGRAAPLHEKRRRETAQACDREQSHEENRPAKAQENPPASSFESDFRRSARQEEDRGNRVEYRREERAGIIDGDIEICAENRDIAEECRQDSGHCKGEYAAAQEQDLDAARHAIIARGDDADQEADDGDEKGVGQGKQPGGLEEQGPVDGKIDDPDHEDEDRNRKKSEPQAPRRFHEPLRSSLSFNSILSSNP